MIITAIVCVFVWHCHVWRWWYAEICSSFGVCCSTVPGLRVLFLLSAQCLVCMFCLHTGLVWWFRLFVCLFFCIPAHPLVYVFNCSFFDTWSYHISIDVDGCSVESLLQRDRWQCIYRTLGKLKSWRVAWIVKEPHTEIQKLPPYYIIHWLGKASKI